jgi:hypothetical protein
MPEKAENPEIVLIILGISLSIFIICTMLDKVLFIQLKKLLKHIMFEKIQDVVNSYLYTE